jgi:hypothetical protein
MCVLGVSNLPLSIFTHTRTDIYFIFYSVLFCMLIMNKIKIKKYHTVGTMTISNIKIVERGKFDTPNTHIHDPGFSLILPSAPTSNCSSSESSS